MKKGYPMEKKEAKKGEMKEAKMPASMRKMMENKEKKGKKK